MRACSGTWIAHGSGSADREVVDAHDRVACRRESPPTAAPDLAHARKRSRATTTALPTRGCGRSAMSRTCGRCSARATGSSTARSTGASPTPSCAEATARIRSCWCRTITSRCCRAMIRERAAARDDHHVLAHPVAESRGVRDLPVARASSSRACSAAASSASTRSSTATTSSIPSTATSRRASSARPSRSRFAAQIDRGPALSDLDRMAAGAAAGAPAVDRRSAARSVRERLGLPPDRSLGLGVDRLDYTKGILERLHRGGAPARAASGVGRPLQLRADRRAVAQRRSSEYRVFERAHARARASASTSASARPALPADHPARRAPRARRGLPSIYRAADALLRVAACMTA